MANNKYRLIVDYPRIPAGTIFDKNADGNYYDSTGKLGWFSAYKVETEKTKKEPPATPIIETSEFEIV